MVLIGDELKFQAKENVWSRKKVWMKNLDKEWKPITVMIVSFDQDEKKDVMDREKKMMWADGDRIY